MTLYHAAQLALAVVAAWIVATRFRSLMYAAPLPARSFRRVLVAAVGGGRVGRAQELAAAAAPAWVGSVAEAVLAARAAGKEPELAVEPVLLELRYEASRGLWALRAMASLASASGLLGAVLALLGLLVGDRGLEGLVAGLPERLAFQRALLSVLIGLVVSGVCLYARSILRRQALRLLRDVEETRDALEDALGVKEPASPP